MNFKKLFQIIYGASILVATIVALFLVLPLAVIIVMFDDDK
tara:strand:+ start:1009 stop:1131 length:123 start_codon:yes stop_codon:yes gene_type:complete